MVEFFKDLFLLAYIPHIGRDTSLGLLFILGVLTSFHCMGMCGGIVISQSIRKTEQPDSHKRYFWLLPSTLYNLGRILGYTIVGATVGGLGQLIVFSGFWKGMIPIFGGLFMIIMGINFLGYIPFLRRLSIPMPYFVAKKIQKSHYAPLLVGLLSGLMPCGPLQTVQLYALGTRNIFFGALSMFIFSVGTVPVMFTLGAFSSSINKKYANKMMKASTVLVVILGFIMVGRGLTLSGINVNVHHLMGHQSDDLSAAAIEENSQTVTTTISSGSYPSIVVRKGIPVKWIIKADEENLNECNHAIIIPKYKIERKLEAGDNTIEFTPTEEGEFVYTCWMGMITGNIKVVHAINKPYQ